MAEAAAVRSPSLSDTEDTGATDKSGENGARCVFVSEQTRRQRLDRSGLAARVQLDQLGNSGFYNQQRAFAASRKGQGVEKPAGLAALAGPGSPLGRRKAVMPTWRRRLRPSGLGWSVWERFLGTMNSSMRVWRTGGVASGETGARGTGSRLAEREARRFFARRFAASSLLRRFGGSSGWAGA